MSSIEEAEYIRATLCQADDTFWMLFRALGDCVRYRMTKVMLRYRRMAVSDLARITAVSVPAASQHLRVLERAGLVSRKRLGRSVIYELREDDVYVGRIIDLIDLWINERSLHGIPTAA